MFKSKEKKEIERKVRIRKSKTIVQSYIGKLEHLQKRVFGQGKEYAKLGDDKMVKNQASKYLALPGAFLAKSHLTPVEKPAPPLPLKPDLEISSITASGDMACSIFAIA